MTANRYWATDAHGRPMVSTPRNPVTNCWCSGRTRPPKARNWAKAVVVSTAILTSGLVVSTLLLVVRDIALAVAGSSGAGLLLKALFAPSDQRDR